MENQELDLVEVSTPSETYKGTAGRDGSGNVEEPAPNNRERGRE
jgi:hypothetical protein